MPREGRGGRGGEGEGRERREGRGDRLTLTRKRVGVGRRASESSFHLWPKAPAIYLDYSPEQMGRSDF